ncbi:hypothetical protein NKH77_37035 [Streptomyces sp. M19]
MDPEPRGETDRGSSPQRAQGTGRTPGDEGQQPAHGGTPTGGGESAERSAPQGSPAPARE